MIALYKDPEGKHIFEIESEGIKAIIGHISSNISSQVIDEGEAKELKLTTEGSSYSLKTTHGDSTLNTCSGTS